ncbi:NAD(P)-dependent oxidoreductase [Lutimonas saemankumensis]|uniref:NAD-dependent epimerase/dehydratase family protein n=1 Tax=Lutimonas saemankumensis TaxID=483016 RepID=UPI001CD45347|nr:NAD(P)-dependent oxidoreductase [Lutimonas saemankumensis]MCA0931055.1 NAD(P)-dependent oxidoreductase [Lutimonas saemankumensis]
MNFKNSKIIVTGASGFIGSVLVEKLLDHGAMVYAVSRSYKKLDNSITWKIGNLTDRDFVFDLVDSIQPDYFFHLASHVVGSRSREYVKSTFEDNLISTVNILEALCDSKCKRVIITGSLEEGKAGQKPIVPSSPYAASKIAASNYARMFHELYGLPVSIATLYMVYGPGQKDLKKLVPYTILNMMKGNIPNISSGVREIDWIYVEDVAEALICMSRAPKIEGKSIDIGSGQLISIKDFILKLTNLMNPNLIPKFGAVKDRKMEQVRKANTDMTYKLLGWKAKTNLETGLLKTINFYKNI